MHRWAEYLFAFILLATGLLNAIATTEVGARVLRTWAISNGLVPEPTADFVRNVNAQGFLTASGTRSWWGAEWRMPTRDGGDYLAVLARRDDNDYKLSWALGALLEKERARGFRFELILIPKDSSQLFLEERTLYLERADGSRHEMLRSVFLPEYVQRLTDVPLEQVPYDPLLTIPEVEAIRRTSGLEHLGHGFHIVHGGKAAAGTWVLHADPILNAEFYLVPLELSPAWGNDDS